jgi:hypothetical protein
MNKIPTVFKRDKNNRKYVTEEVLEECQWVLDGEGVATRKYDGTCVMLDDTGNWWSRREVKPNKPTPPNFVEVNLDEFTGKRIGWVPLEPGGYYHPFLQALGLVSEVKMKTSEAIQDWIDQITNDYMYEPGTYELVGPKINGNPEGKENHELIRHEDAFRFTRRSDAGPLTFEIIRDLILTHHQVDGMEGLVWHHPDGRMAKLKARDFPS